MKRCTLLLLSIVGTAACGPDADYLDTAESVSGLVSDKIPDVYHSYYRVRDRRHGRSFDVSSSGALYPRTVYHGGDNQQFIIVPVAYDSNQFYIVPKHSGGVLTAFLYGTLPVANAYPSAAARERFILGPDQGGDNFNIRTTHTTGNFDAPSSGAIYVGTPHSGTNQQFHFESVAPFPYPTPLEFDGPEPGAIGDIPRITAYGQTPPLSSPPVLISEGPIPFVYVKGDNSRSYQAVESPYYKLTREQFWTRVDSDEKPADASFTESYTVKHGMSRTDSQRIETTLGFSLKQTGEAAFTIQAFKLTLGTTLEGTFKMVTTLETTVTHTEEIEESMTFAVPPGRRVAWAAWHLTDRYSLYRMDGSLFDSWDLVYRDARIVDAYSE